MAEYQPKTYKPSSPEQVISQLTPQEREMVVDYHVSTHVGCTPQKALEVCLPKGVDILANALIGAAMFREVSNPKKLGKLRDDLRGVSIEECERYREYLREERRREGQR